MTLARAIQSGNRQAVRLPKECQLRWRYSAEGLI